MNSGNKDSEKDSAMHVMDGIHSSHDGLKRTRRRKFVKKQSAFSLDTTYEQLITGSRIHLAQAITLIESLKRSDQDVAQDLLKKALPHTGKSIRLGISGIPGVGKSTFIETFGYMLCELGYKVAVLAIDPSSSVTGGSVLGDKTRMEKLGSHPNAFIRPSPTSGTLGGVHRKTRETMLLCEAAGYDIILIETVGVGQSETAVRNMVDFFMLLALTGAGDDLQGMKKGIMEITDLIIVHKADGDNVRLAKRTVREYKQILHLLQPATPGWSSTSLAVSSYKNIGHDDVWEQVQSFRKQMIESNYWEERRKEQTKSWFHDMIQDRLIEEFFSEPEKQKQVDSLEQDILNGDITITGAVTQLFSK